jgi:uncharacterized protein YceK
MLLAIAVLLLAGCQAMNEKIDASRQERCHKADWAMVGERDGVEGATTMADRYAHICGELYNATAYKEGLQKGLARRPRPPV